MGKCAGLLAVSAPDGAFPLAFISLASWHTPQAVHLCHKVNTVISLHFCTQCINTVLLVLYPQPDVIYGSPKPLISCKESPPRWHLSSPGILHAVVLILKAAINFISRAKRVDSELNYNSETRFGKLSTSPIQWSTTLVYEVRNTPHSL